MVRGASPIQLTCPECRQDLVHLEVTRDEVHRLGCPECGRRFRARRARVHQRQAIRTPVGGVSLALRCLMLRGLPWAYRTGVGLGSIPLLGAGWAIPVVRGWMDDEIRDLGGVVTRLGGVRVTLPVGDPDLDFGPRLPRAEAPGLFDAIEEIARRLGGSPPEEVRLAFLPCCGVVARGKARILLIGLPLLHVLNRAEFRAVLAHEMAHLARGDATRVMDALRFVEALGRGLDDPDGRSRGPLRAWARACRRVGVAIAGPIARGQEARADRASALVAGGRAAASALAKVAIVQPLFREVLGRFRDDRPDRPNLFATFRLFWDRLPGPLLDAMRLRLHAEREAHRDDPHPPLAVRLGSLQAYPDPPESPADLGAASGWLNDPEWLEEMLHASLFRRGEDRPSVFHRAGS